MHSVYKSSVDGEFVSEEYAKANPDTTYKTEVEDDHETEVEYQGLTHMCDDPDCHVPGFIQTLIEHPPHMSTQLSEADNPVGLD